MRKHFTNKRLSATVYYGLAALVASWFGLAATPLLLSDWETGAISSAASLATVHATVLGFMLTMVWGVLYQVVPIAFQAPPIARHVLYWHLPAHLAAVLLMVIGFLSGSYPLVGVGGTLLLSASLAFLTIAQRSFAKARNRTVVYQHLVIPFTALITVMLLGLWMAFGLPGADLQVLLTHVLLGGLGFWVSLVMIVSYKFVPMFALSHGYKSSLPWAIRLFFLGVFVIVAILWVGPSWNWLRLAGGLLALIGCIKFGWDMVSILRARKRKRIVYPLRIALVATTMILLATVGILLSVLFETAAWIPQLSYLLIFGGFTPLIFSYLQKIVPFLWYEFRFSHHKDRKTAPLIDEMVPARPARFAIGLYYLGFAIGWAAVLLRLPLPEAMQILLAALGVGSSLLLFFALTRVLTIGGPRIDIPE